LAPRDKTGFYWKAPKMALICLKNLQNSRICHVLMWLAKSTGCVLYHTRDFSVGRSFRDHEQAGISV
jgi:hypothetical protein